jgi:hypothetical protein
MLSAKHREARIVRTVATGTRLKIALDETVALAEAYCKQEQNFMAERKKTWERSGKRWRSTSRHDQRIKAVEDAIAAMRDAAGKI